jgi:hypothetical protein
MGKLIAIIAAAACAGFAVAFVPGFAPEVAAGAAEYGGRVATAPLRADRPIEMWAPSAAGIQLVLAESLRRASHAAATPCVGTWPYYESSCLRDERQPNGGVRIVRVIAPDRTVVTARNGS